MKRAILLLPALGLLLLGLTGCLLPAEEELPTLPVIDQEAAPEYEYATVTRGDLVHRELLTLSVVASQQENLSYLLTGQTIQTVYVAAGDRVRAGDLICELENSSADRELEELTQELSQAETALDWAQKDLDICLTSASLSVQAAAYEDQVRELTDQITVLEARQQELLDQKEAGRLYCSIDGIVTYAKASGSISIKNNAVVTITSRSDSEYYCDTAYYEALPEGTEVEVVIDEVGYRAQVSGWEETPKSNRPGKEPQEDQKRVFFTITDPASAQIDPDSRGSVDLLIDSREDVLILPAQAVVYTDTGALVYQVEEASGLMTVTPVTVGLQVEDEIELTGGLSEGDRVIVN